MIRTSLFVRLCGGRGVLERRLEIAEMLRGEEEGNGDRKPVSICFGKKDRESLSRLSFNELATNNVLGLIYLSNSKTAAMCHFYVTK